MITPVERWVLDTNVWVFALRGDRSFPACAELLDQIGSFCAVVPRQVLNELRANLTDTEMQEFYQLVNRYSESIELSWELAPAERVKFYEDRGCRKGDAVIAAHAEMLGANLLVSENRQFLQTLTNSPTEVVTASEARSRLIST